jgi:hypothetical protein
MRPAPPDELCRRMFVVAEYMEPRVHPGILGLLVVSDDKITPSAWEWLFSDEPGSSVQIYLWNHRYC